MTDVVERGYLIARQRDRHRRRIDAALDMIRDHWDDATNPPGTEHAGRRTAPGSRPPLPIEHASVIDEAQRVLRSWAALVVDERRVGPPRRNDGKSVAHYLTLHAEWIAAHETAKEAATELERQGRAIRDLALGRRTRRFHVGRCPEKVGEEKPLPCDGSLWAIIRDGIDHDGMLPDRIVCDRCGHTWAPHEWTTLGRHLVGTLDRTGVDRLVARLGIRYSTSG